MTWLSTSAGQHAPAMLITVQLNPSQSPPASPPHTSNQFMQRRQCQVASHWTVRQLPLMLLHQGSTRLLLARQPLAQRSEPCTVPAVARSSGVCSTSGRTSAPSAQTPIEQEQPAPAAAQSVTQTILAQPSLEGDPAQFLKVGAFAGVIRRHLLPDAECPNPCRCQRRTGRYPLACQQHWSALQGTRSMQRGHASRP